MNLPPGYELKPCGLTVGAFEALVLTFNGADTGRGFLSPPTQADADNAVDCHRRELTEGV